MPVEDNDSPIPMVGEVLVAMKAPACDSFGTRHQVCLKGYLNRLKAAKWLRDHDSFEGCSLKEVLEVLDGPQGFVLSTYEDWTFNTTEAQKAKEYDRVLF